MELAGRLFGFNSWTLLVPQALEGVLAVALLYATVRRWFGPAAGLIAGGGAGRHPGGRADVPVRQPDALMTLLLVAAAYFVTRAIDDGRLRWMLLAGGVMGLDFLTKGLQPFTVLPALALVLPRRLGCFAAPAYSRTCSRRASALVAGAAWWVLAVALWPASDRPYIGGSTNNSALDLAFGYNGLGRITGNETGAGGGGGGGGPTFSGQAGIGRLFNSEMGTQIAWLLPAALIALVALVALAGGRRAPTGRAPRLLLWGGWLVVTGLVLSYAGGIIHPYYTVELAPAIAALVGIGVGACCGAARGLARPRGPGGRRRSDRPVELRAAGAHAGLEPVAALRCCSCSPSARAVALLVPPQRLARGASGRRRRRTGRRHRRLVGVCAEHGGRTPQRQHAVGRAGVGRGHRWRARRSWRRPTGPADSAARKAARHRAARRLAGPAVGKAARHRAAASRVAARAARAARLLAVPRIRRWPACSRRRPPAGRQRPSATRAPRRLELASGKAVMAIGGWSGSDPAPTLAQFKAYVAAGDISYYVAAGGGGPGGGNSEIANWVAANYTATTVGGSTVYDLTKASS